jgi:6-pyruvoyltetrahydropterin/6-carboxytetrahydropterin synthase
VPHYFLAAETMFSGAHTLPGVPQCERMHGHNWRIRVTVRVEEGALDAAGIGVDFRVVQQAAQHAVADFDHAYLNDLAPFRSRPPSAERVAAVICERVTQHLATDAPPARVDHVDVWETPHFRVTYHPD